MATVNVKDKEEATQDFLTRLPDDVLLSILSRLEDLKFLLRCSLVSKRFSAMISGINSVSLALPSIIMQSPDSMGDLYELFPVILECSSADIIAFIETSSIQELKFSVSLQKFTDLRSISLEFTSSTIFFDPPFLKWKPECRGNGNMVEGIVSLFATSASQMTEAEFGEPRPRPRTPCRFSLSHIKCSVFYPLRTCKEWLFVLCLVLKCQPSLESITITNSKKEAMLVLKGEKLVDLRTNLFCRKLESFSYPDTLKMAWLPELYLRSSQCLLVGVSFVAMMFPLDSAANLEDNALNWEYGKEEKLLGEAVKEILTNHRDRLKKLCFNPFDDSDDDLE